MTVLAFGLDVKFGGEGLAALGIRADDRLPNGRGRRLDDALAGCEPPVLLLFHGQRKMTDDLLARHAALHVLHVKTTRHRYGDLRDREREFEFAVPSLPGGGRWGETGARGQGQTAPGRRELPPGTAGLDPDRGAGGAGVRPRVLSGRAGRAGGAGRLAA